MAAFAIGLGGELPKTLIEAARTLFPDGYFMPILLSDVKSTGDWWYKNIFYPLLKTLPAEEAANLNRDAVRIKERMNTWSGGEFGNPTLLGEVAKLFQSIEREVLEIGGRRDVDIYGRYRDGSLSMMAALAAGYDHADKTRGLGIGIPEMFQRVTETIERLILADMWVSRRDELGEAPAELKLKDGESYALYWATKLENVPEGGDRIGHVLNLVGFDIARNLEWLEQQKPPGANGGEEYFAERAARLHMLNENVKEFVKNLPHHSVQPWAHLSPLLVEALKTPLGQRESRVRAGEEPKVKSERLSSEDRVRIRKEMERKEERRDRDRDEIGRGAEF